jgi:hypothetical protein
MQHGLSDHAVFKCINFIRSKVAEGMDPLSDLGKRPFVFDDDKYLKPVLPDDMLLCHDFEADDEARYAPQHSKRLSSFYWSVECTV